MTSSTGAWTFATTPQALAGEGLVGAPRAFARNALVLALAEEVDGEPAERRRGARRAILQVSDTPPSTGMTPPVTKEAPSPARKTAARAISSGAATRCMACRPAAPARASGVGFH